MNKLKVVLCTIFICISIAGCSSSESNEKASKTYESIDLVVNGESYKFDYNRCSFLEDYILYYVDNSDYIDRIYIYQGNIVFVNENIPILVSRDFKLELI